MIEDSLKWFLQWLAWFAALIAALVGVAGLARVMVALIRRWLKGR